MKRLRPEEIEAVIINTAFEELQERGFRAVTIESISANGYSEGAPLPSLAQQGRLLVTTLPW